jgi:hypothetical protein
VAVFLHVWVVMAGMFALVLFLATTPLLHHPDILLGMVCGVVGAGVLFAVLDVLLFAVARRATRRERATDAE